VAIVLRITWVAMIEGSARGGAVLCHGAPAGSRVGGAIRYAARKPVSPRPVFGSQFTPSQFRLLRLAHRRRRFGQVHRRPVLCERGPEVGLK
jgi:hypothetical protein